MTEYHEKTGQTSDEWYTPPEIFKGLGIMFDLDPCSPGKSHLSSHVGSGYVPCRECYTKHHDGLNSSWYGTVFMNPPFGGRNGVVPWLRKFVGHGNGIAIVRAYTSSGWWHDWVPRVDYVCFPRGKTKFIRPDGSVGKSPGAGVAILSMGEKCNEALIKCGLGWVVKA